MAFDIQYPNITATTEKGQYEQIRSYLYQLADQLKWALNSLDTAQSNTAQVISQSKGSVANSTQAESNFNQIKGLIIKSADIVEAYSEEISKRLEGSYVASSEFGTYMQETALEIEGTSTSLTQMYSNIQSLLDEVRKTNAYIKTGELYTDDNGNTRYGVEVGEEIDGQFVGIARFTSNKLAFIGGYSSDGVPVEVAYISNYKLYITNAEITGSLTLGKYIMNTTDGIVIKWIG